MQFTIDNRDRLLEMKPGEDAVWMAAKTPVFQTHDGYFGHYLSGNPDDPWTVDCIEGTSPKVFMPQKLTYVGRFDMPDSRSDYLFVFSAKNDDLRFYGRVMPWYHNGFTSFADAKRLSGGTFCNLLSERSLLAKLQPGDAFTCGKGGTKYVVFRTAVVDHEKVIAYAKAGTTIDGEGFISRDDIRLGIDEESIEECWDCLFDVNRLGRRKKILKIRSIEKAVKGNDGK